MIKIRELVKVESLEEAWELNQKRTNKIPVSYTHLDVYKRQSGDSQAAGGFYRKFCP